MKIINQSNNLILANDAFVANRIFSRLKGLLGRKEFPSGKGIILKPCNSIHTFFMAFSIDVLFVGKDNRVKKVIENLVPNRLSCIYFDAAFAIELPAGTIKACPISAGDTIILQD